LAALTKIKKKRKFFNLQTRRDIIGWAFVFPAFSMFGVFVLAPIMIALVAGFSDFNGIDYFGRWGLQNYRHIFTEDRFRFILSLRNLIFYVLLFVPLNLIISFVIAILASGKNRSKKYFRLAFYIPALTSGVAVGAVWSWLLNPQAGIINESLRALGITNPPNWTNNPNLTIVVITIVSLWGGTAVNMVLFVAAIHGVNESLIEAARIEGAGRLRIVIFIIIPLISPITYFVVTTVFIGAFQLFDPVMMVFGDGGGPQMRALTPIMVINRTANTLFYGLGSAMSTILLAIVLVLTNIIQFFSRKINRGVDA